MVGCVCSYVRCFVVHMPGVALVEFFSLIRSFVLLSDLDADLDGHWLFPRALQIPSWRHAVDIVLHRALEALS